MDLSHKELYVDSVEFSYSYGQQLLTGAYLHCKVGDVVGLLGRNGCGKSTLMKIIFGTIVPKHAFLRLNGKRMSKLYLSHEVCYLPQQHFLPTSKSVKDLIHLFIRDNSVSEAITKDDIIEKLLQTKVADLSTGEVRYLEFLLLIHQKAAFILLDEPFSGVSPLLKERIQAWIQRFRSQKGFVVSDHHYQSVLGICTKIVLLENGGCRQVHSKKELEFHYLPEGTFDEE